MVLFYLRLLARFYYHQHQLVQLQQQKSSVCKANHHEGQCAMLVSSRKNSAEVDFIMMWSVGDTPPVPRATVGSPSPDLAMPAARSAAAAAAAAAGGEGGAGATNAAGRFQCSI